MNRAVPCNTYMGALVLNDKHSVSASAVWTFGEGNEDLLMESLDHNSRHLNTRTAFKHFICQSVFLETPVHR